MSKFRFVELEVIHMGDKYVAHYREKVNPHYVKRMAPSGGGGTNAPQTTLVWLEGSESPLLVNQAYEDVALVMQVAVDIGA